MKFYLCNVCKNLIEMVEDAGNNPICCSRDMQELIPGTSDGAVEKHLPVVHIESLSDSCDDIKKVIVKIGEVDHPMIESHYIKWICIETEHGNQRIHLKPGDAPCAEFYIRGNAIKAVYAYCNLHGLWKTTL